MSALDAATAALMAANRHARTHARDPGASPHWLRCNHVEGDRRCIKGDGHMGEHAFVKEAA